jgi:hypothetical protein
MECSDRYHFCFFDLTLLLAELGTQLTDCQPVSQPASLSSSGRGSSSSSISAVAAGATHSYKQFILLCLNIVERRLKERSKMANNQLFSLCLNGGLL